MCDLRHIDEEKFVKLSLQRIDTKLEAMEEALVLRSSELERRLEGLNQLRADVVNDRDQFIRRDIYDMAQREFREFKDRYTMAHQDLAVRLTKLETRAVVWGVALTVIFVVIHLIMHFFTKGG